MIFLPSSCERCGNIALISTADCMAERARCGSCAGPVTILRGPAYPEGDVLLFNELVALIEVSGLVGVFAEQLAFALETARFVFDEQEALRLLALRVPGFGPLAPLLNANVERARQALSMSDTILRALAKDRRSGVHGGPDASVEPIGTPGTGDWQQVEPRARAWRNDGQRR